MTSLIHSSVDFDCWKKGRELRLFVVHQVIPHLPKDEKYRLGDQLLRAARSTTANIAEGYGRFHYLDNAKFCSNARGSCQEVLDHLITAHDEELISDEVLRRGRDLASTALRIVNGYLNYLKRAQNPNNQAPSTANRSRACSAFFPLTIHE